MKTFKFISGEYLTISPTHLIAYTKKEEEEDVDRANLILLSNICSIGKRTIYDEDNTYYFKIETHGSIHINLYYTPNKDPSIEEVSQCILEQLSNYNTVKL